MERTDEGDGMQETKCLGGLSDQIWGSQYHQQDRVYSMGDCALALPANLPGGSYKYIEIFKKDEEGKWQRLK